jgi:hypothetical protein
MQTPLIENRDISTVTGMQASGDDRLAVVATIRRQRQTMILS